VPRTRIERLVREEISVTPDTAFRLGRLFSKSPEFWLAMQSLHDLTEAEMASQEAIRAIEPLALPNA
jgi:antitoxin HigA-1